MRRLLALSLPLWLCGFALTWVVVQTPVHCHVQQTAFHRGSGFLGPFLRYPGGVTEYAALYLMQFLTTNWGGAVVVAAVCAAFLLLGAMLLPPADRDRSGVLLLLQVPGVLIVTLMLDCLFPLAVPVRLLLAWVALLPVARLVPHPRLRAAVAVLLVPAVYMAAGGAALWVWVAGLVALELRRFRGIRSLGAVAAIGCLAALLVWAGHHWLFLIEWSDAWWLLVPRLPYFVSYQPDAVLYLWCAWLPVVLLASRWLPPRARTMPASAGPGLPARDDPARGTWVGRRWIRAVPGWTGDFIELLAIAAIGAGLLHSQIQPLERARWLATYYAELGRWDKVIETVQLAPRYDPFLDVEWARALAHTGALGESLFHYPQVLGVDGLFPDKYPAGQTAMPSSDLYLDLGYVAAAQRWAFEAQTVQPFAPKALKRLVTTSVILGDYRLAAKYLGVLERDPTCRAWVEEQRALLADTAKVAADSLLSTKRRQMPGGGIIPEEAHEKLKALLAREPTNRMAYEYLLAYYLLMHQLGDFTARLSDWRQFGYTQLPRTFQEGLLLYVSRVPDARHLLSEYSVSAAALNGFAEFGRILARNQGNPEAARPELLRRFAGTYWYYVTYQSPLVTKVQLKTRKVE